MSGKNVTGPLDTNPTGGKKNRGRPKGSKGKVKMTSRFSNILGYCVCPKCDAKMPRIAGEPSSSNICPDCGILMIRE